MTLTLEGKEIVLAVTGSIAAVETIRLAHALRRRGACVQGVMSAAAAGILHPDALTYATGRETITRCSGLIEHVEWCGEEGRADLLLVAPCTANTLGKISCGIDDTPVTTFATTALGSGIPVILAPAMHGSMYRHPAMSGHITRLGSWGVTVIPPKVDEGRAKIAENEVLVLYAERALMGRPLKGRQVLVTSGPCREPVDDVRVLTTRSSGMMGREVALQAFRLGARVTVVHEGVFPVVENVPVMTASEMMEAVLALCEDSPPDIYVSAAAISDFAPEQVPGKIPSGKPVDIRLRPLPKVIDEVMKRCNPFTIAFKLGENAASEAEDLLEKGASLVFANQPGMLGATAGKAVIITGTERVEVEGNKEELAGALWREAVRHSALGTYQGTSVR